MRVQCLEAEKTALTAQIARLNSLGGAASRRINKVEKDYEAFVENVKKTIKEDNPSG